MQELIDLNDWFTGLHSSTQRFVGWKIALLITQQNIDDWQEAANIFPKVAKDYAEKEQEVESLLWIIDGELARMKRPYDQFLFETSANDVAYPPDMEAQLYLDFPEAASIAHAFYLSQQHAVLTWQAIKTSYLE